MFKKMLPMIGPKTAKITMTTRATSTRISAYSTNPCPFSLPVLMNIALKTFCPERTTSVAPHTANTFHVLRLTYALDDRRFALPHTHAQRRQPVPRLPPAQLVDERRHQPGAGAAQRVTQRNRAAVDVEPVEGDTQFARADKRLHGKRFIDLEQVNIGDGESGAFEQAKGYVRELGVLRDVVVTDGIRYRMYAAARDPQDTLRAVS